MRESEQNAAFRKEFAFIQNKNAFRKPDLLVVIPMYDTLFPFLKKGEKTGGSKLIVKIRKKNFA